MQWQIFRILLPYKNDEKGKFIQINLFLFPALKQKIFFCLSLIKR